MVARKKKRGTGQQKGVLRIESGSTSQKTKEEEHLDTAGFVVVKKAQTPPASSSPQDGKHTSSPNAFGRDERGIEIAASFTHRT
jgi:hypothetical protein